MTLYAFLEMSYINIERKDIHKILVTFRLFKNLLQIRIYHRTIYIIVHKGGPASPFYIYIYIYMLVNAGILSSAQ